MSDPEAGSGTPAETIDHEPGAKLSPLPTSVNVKSWLPNTYGGVVEVLDWIVTPVANDLTNHCETGIPLASVDKTTTSAVESVLIPSDIWNAVTPEVRSWKTRFGASGDANSIEMVMKSEVVNGGETETYGFPVYW
jgi:hypothetical protein